MEKQRIMVKSFRLPGGAEIEWEECSVCGDSPDECLCNLCFECGGQLESEEEVEMGWHRECWDLEEAELALERAREIHEQHEIDRAMEERYWPEGSR